MRKPMIVGNWKMNKSPSATVGLIYDIIPLLGLSGREVVVCPPTACLFAARGAIGKANIKLGAQNMHYEDTGAFTGETSVEALLELGVDYVLIGHSERRQYFAETDKTVNKKVLKALRKRINPIICVGETLGQWQDRVTKEIIRTQVKYALKNVGAGYITQVIIAYEPIWAIGTGETATTENANNTIREIRSTLRELYGAELAGEVRILYGGSMDPGNAGSLISMSDIDGGLIGKASLKADDFAKIINS